MVRFARTVETPKVWSTIKRVHAAFEEFAEFRSRPMFFAKSIETPERLAADLLGGDAGERWAAAAVAAGPAEHSSITGVLDAAESVAEFAAVDQLAAFEGRKPEWAGVLGLEGVATSDMRFINVGALTWRELPLTLQDQLLSQDGHDGATAVGPITNIFRRDNGDGSASIMGEGLFDSGSEGIDARRRLAEGTKQGCSMDLTEVELDLPDDPEAMERILMGEDLLRIRSGRIGAVTLVTVPAFEGARLRVVGDMPEDREQMEALVASGGRAAGSWRVIVPIDVPEPVPFTWAPVSFLPEGATPTDATEGVEAELYDIDPAEVVDLERLVESDYRLGSYQADATATLVASGTVPRPPASWFEQASYNQSTPFRVEEPDSEGLRRIHGHIALRNSCHISFPGQCRDLPVGLDYSSFQGDGVPGRVRCSDGSVVVAGPVVMSTEHAAIRDARGRPVSGSDAVDHYAHTGSLVSQVRAYEDQFGLQVQGWVVPWATEEQVAVLDAVDLSPDWRPRVAANGGLGVVAILAVPVSGFNLGLAASGGPGTASPAVVETDGRKMAALATLGVEVDQPSSRRDAALATLTGSCGCSRSCCSATS